MPDRIKKILDKVLAWWNKFTTKQKTIIVGASAAVIFTFAIFNLGVHKTAVYPVPAVQLDRGGFQGHRNT